MAVKSVVVAKLGGWGDTVMASFVGPAVKEAWPEAKVTLVLGKSLSDWAGALQFDDVILVDDRLFYSKNKTHQGAEMASAILKLRSKSFDLGFSLHHSGTFGALFKLAGVKKTVGFKNSDGKFSNLPILGRMLNYDIAVDLKSKKSEIDRFHSLLLAAGADVTRLNFKLKVRQSVHLEIQYRLQKLGLEEKKFMIIGPGGGDNAQRKFYHKRWTFFPEFARIFCERTELPILLLGGPTDQDLVPPLINVNPKRIFSWVAKTTREEALATIGMAHSFVGCDSGLGHVAGCVGVPGVMIFGPSSSAQNSPPGMGKNIICIDGQVPCAPCYRDDGNFNWSCRDNVCMKSISPEDVWKQLKTIALL